MTKAETTSNVTIKPILVKHLQWLQANQKNTDAFSEALLRNELMATGNDPIAFNALIRYYKEKEQQGIAEVLALFKAAMYNDPTEKELQARFLEHPNVPDAFYNIKAGENWFLIHQLLKQKHYEKVNTLLMEMLNQVPGYSRVLEYLAGLAVVQGEWALASAFYYALHLQNPSRETYHVQYALALNEAGWEEIASLEALKIHRRFPGSVYATRNMMLLYYQQGNINEAAKMAAFWSAMNRENTESLVTYAYLLNNIGEYTLAIKQLDRVLHKEPEHSVALYQYAHAAFSLGLEEQGMEQVKVLWQQVSDQQELESQLQQEPWYVNTPMLQAFLNQQGAP